MLTQLWLASVYLSVVSLMVMTALIVARIVSRRQHRREEAIRQNLLGRIFDWLSDESAAPPISRVDTVPVHVLQSIAGDLLGLLSGAERQRLVALFVEAGLPQLLDRDLKARSARRAHAAAELLAHFPGPATIAALTEALDHRLAEVRLAAAMSLAELDASPPVDVLIERLHMGIQEHSLLTVDLFRRLLPERRDELIRLARRRDLHFSLRAAALEALSGERDPAMVGPLAELAGSDEVNIAARAVRALGQLGYASAEPAIAAATASPFWQVRVQAASAVGQIGLLDLSERLVELMNDETWWVRLRAAEALLALGERGIDELKAIAGQGQEPSERAFAQMLMNEKGLRWSA